MLTGLTPPRRSPLCLSDWDADVTGPLLLQQIPHAPEVFSQEDVLGTLCGSAAFVRLGCEEAAQGSGSHQPTFADFDAFDRLVPDQLEDSGPRHTSKANCLGNSDSDALHVPSLHT